MFEDDRLKAFERVIDERLRGIVQIRSIQFGFMKDKSTMDTMEFVASARNLNLQDLFSYELAPVPTSMFKDSGAIRFMTDKVKLKRFGSEEELKSPNNGRVERKNGGTLIRMASESRDSDFGGENICGKIKFTLEYDKRESSFIVKIIEAKGLPAKDATGTSDPYVRVTLLPDKKHKIETKIKRRTLNPRWNETLYFQDWDRFSRDDPIGEVSVPLNEVDFSYQLEFTRNLKGTSKLGEILLTLKFNARDDVLNICIKKARNLKIKDITGSSDRENSVMDTMKRRKFKYFGHMVRGGGMARAILEGGGRPMGNWLGNLKEWSGQAASVLIRRAEDRVLWRNSVRAWVHPRLDPG
ncbi:Synaptotagmin-7 [Nymphon striatum]|nr:Synaptotagmin-7 [Nymphon striatum]